jgi:pimeloyl-ACP methyl ester carboxylesterase
MAFFRDTYCTLHYQQRGHGETVLLIHGLGCTGADWAFQVAALERHHRVIIPDLPGSGHSSIPKSGYDIPHIAQTLWRLLDHLDVKNVTIIGFSLGGAVAQQMATSRPEAVSKLALINSLATYRPHTFSKCVEIYGSALAVRLLGMQRAARLAAARLFPESWQQAMRIHAAAAMGAIKRSDYLGLGFALTRWTVVDRLHLIRCPVLMLAAEKDFTPLPEKVTLARTLRATLMIIRGSRHGTPFDSVEVTNAALRAFLRGESLPHSAQWKCDDSADKDRLMFAARIAEEHALSARRESLPAAKLA